MPDLQHPFGDLLIHATCVAWQNRAVLIIGASGRGKSSLGIELMAYGCDLISDDQTCLTLHHNILIASAPDPIRNMIEARGIGLLNAKALPKAQVDLVIDMNDTETHRLPDKRSVSYLGINLPLIFPTGHISFGPAALQFLKAGRSA